MEDGLLCRKGDVSGICNADGTSSSQRAELGRRTSGGRPDMDDGTTTGGAMPVWQASSKVDGSLGKPMTEPLMLSEVTRPVVDNSRGR